MNVLEYAIKMELEGEKFYSGQAARGCALAPVFVLLAQEEAEHANVLRKLADGLPIDAGDVKSSVGGVFSGMKSFAVETKDAPEQLDLYRMALGKEKESIDLYRKLADDMDGARDVFAILVAQEQEHYRVFEEIVELLSRPKEWVESAEFGVREDY